MFNTGFYYTVGCITKWKIELKNQTAIYSFCKTLNASWTVPYFIQGNGLGWFKISDDDGRRSVFSDNTSNCYQQCAQEAETQK